MSVETSSLAAHTNPTTPAATPPLSPRALSCCVASPAMPPLFSRHLSPRRSGCRLLTHLLTVGRTTPLLSYLHATFFVSLVARESFRRLKRPPTSSQYYTIVVAIVHYCRSYSTLSSLLQHNIVVVVIRVHYCLLSLLLEYSSQL